MRFLDRLSTEHREELDQWWTAIAAQEPPNAADLDSQMELNHQEAVRYYGSVE